MSAESPLQNF